MDARNVRQCAVCGNAFELRRPSDVTTTCSKACGYRLRSQRATTPEQAAERFWSKVRKDGVAPVFAPHLGACWLWIGAKTELGYGRVGVYCGEKRFATTGAHRRSYEMTFGSIPIGFHLDHLCRVPECVNPNHLQPVTPEENQ